MEEAGGSRRKRRWVLANVVGGVALIVVLAVVLAGSPGSGEAPGIDTSLQSHGPPAAHPARACTQFQRMVNECPDPTTTTTTSTSPPTTPGPSGSGSTTYSYSTSSSGSTATPSTAPAAQAAPADPGAAATAAGSAAVAADPAACSGATPPVGAPGGSWHCTFDDEFNGTSLDTSKWAAMTTYGSNYRTGPLFHQVCYVNSPSTISESGGYLDLSVVQTAQPVTCPGVYNSDGTTDVVGGEVISYNLFSQQYGFFEASAEMPASSVPGLQDTLWLYPENETLYGPWPDSGEIDFGEWYSNYANNDIPANLYPGSHNDPNSESNTCVISGQSPAGQFHTYALLWTPTTLTTYYDGMACLTDTYAPYVTNPDTAPAPFNQPFFLSLTAALGDFNGDQYRPGVTPLPATMKVDWVRAWQYGG